MNGGTHFVVPALFETPVTLCELTLLMTNTNRPKD
jgi:hypothetical protein